MSIIAKQFSLAGTGYDPSWNLRVKKVGLVLSSSRSGSSVLVSVLRNSPDVYSIDGEIDPYLALTGNGFLLTSESDKLDRVYNHHWLLENIFKDLGTYSPNVCSLEEIKEKWQRRFLMQFPLYFSVEPNYTNMCQAIDRALGGLVNGSLQDERIIHTTILEHVFADQPQWRAFYDGFGKKGEQNTFGMDAKLEEPPFVVPRLNKKAITEDDLENKLLLFKAPQDAYRLQIYRQLFPNAEFSFVHLTRGFAQAVNGLVDGWLSPTGFFSHDIGGRTGEDLQIAGYSDVTSFGRRWWKFDLPANWEEFRRANIFEVCCNQWVSAHRAILNAGITNPLRVKFEDVLQDRATELQRISEHFGISLEAPEQLPLVMATSKPEPSRWKVRQNQIIPLAARSDVNEIMQEFDYSMQPEHWR